MVEICFVCHDSDTCFVGVVHSKKEKYCGINHVKLVENFKSNDGVAASCVP